MISFLAFRREYHAARLAGRLLWGLPLGSGHLLLVLLARQVLRPRKAVGPHGDLNLADVARPLLRLVVRAGHRRARERGWSAWGAA